MGHNLGMSHAFVDRYNTNPNNPMKYNMCRRVSDGSELDCNRCDNWNENWNDRQSPNWKQYILPANNRPDDCCNGFMGYDNTPQTWSACSVRMFENHYISQKWSECMDTTTGNHIPYMR